MKAKEWLGEFPGMIEYAYKLGEGVKFKGIEKVLVCGMGGSAIAGDMLSSIIKIPVQVNRGYGTPNIDGKTLVVVSSYSGNTEETISAWEKARKKTEKIIIITSGGRLGKEKNKILIPGNFQPRFALPYSFFPLLRVIDESGIGAGTDLKDIVSAVKKVSRKTAKGIAVRMKNKIPLVYTTSNYASAAYRWKTQINENAKTFCHTNLFTELNHNEVEMFDKRGKYFAVLIRDKNEHAREKKQIEATKESIKHYKEVWVKGNSHAAKLFYAIYLGDWVSLYLADEKGVDPAKYRNIEYIKGRIK
jgi:glucose/mannose-6-phosphate isomerase